MSILGRLRLFGASLLALGCSGTSPSSGRVANAGQGAANSTEVVTVRSWLEKAALDARPLYWERGGACVAWTVRILDRSPLKMVLSNTTEIHSNISHVYVRKVGWRQSGEDAPVLQTGSRHWSQRVIDDDWEAGPAIVGTEFSLSNRRPELVPGNRAVVIVALDWWWYDTYEDCIDGMNKRGRSEPGFGEHHGRWGWDYDD